MWNLLSRLSLLALLACTGGGSDPCAERSVEACEDLASCALVYGRELSWRDDITADTAADTATEGTCYDAGDSEPLGCGLAELACPPSIKFGTSPEGSCYEFGGCVPQDFTECPQAEGLTECS
jgi:hypothetical protein